MKILVTGAAGFVGSHTAQRLHALGHEVIGVDNFSDYYDVSIKQDTANDLLKDGIPIITLDLRQAESYNLLAADFDYIFHFAAQPGISSSSTFDQYLSNNLIATQLLLEFALKNTHLKQFINIATSSVYGLHAFFDENKPTMPASHYGVTKLAAEQLVLALSRSGKLCSTSLRLYSVFGPRERPDKLYPILIDAALKNKPFSLFEGSEKHLRSFTFVEDIVDGIVSVIGKEEIVNGEIFNLGTEVELTTQEGIETVQALLNKKIAIQVVPKRAGDQLRTKAVIDKARKLLDYHPKTSLKQGLEKHIEWYLSKLNQ